MLSTPYLFLFDQRHTLWFRWRYFFSFDDWREEVNYIHNWISHQFSLACAPPPFQLEVGIIYSLVSVSWWLSTHCFPVNGCLRALRSHFCDQEQLEEHTAAAHLWSEHQKTPRLARSLFTTTADAKPFAVWKSVFSSHWVTGKSKNIFSSILDFIKKFASDFPLKNILNTKIQQLRVHCCTFGWNIFLCWIWVLHITWNLLFVSGNIVIEQG